MFDLLWIIPITLFGAGFFAVGYVVGAIIGETRATKILHGHFMSKGPDA